MKISITLPSIYPDSARRAIDNINERSCFAHEILVVSDFEATGDNVVWIKETERKGVAHAQHVAAQHATGDYVTAFADDYEYVPNWDAQILADFTSREGEREPFVMGVRYGLKLIGTCFGLYYPNFPFMRRSVIKEIGYISPDYVRGFGDCDLGMRVWAAGGVCEFSQAELMFPIMGDFGKTLDDVRKAGALCTDDDRNLFVSRWSNRFGKGWDTRTLRGFNLDVDTDFYAYLLKDNRTICMNEPSFKKKIFVYD